MRIHHLNCATMCPFAAEFLNEQHRLVAHCLLVEGPRGLVLVDSGFGTADVQGGRLPQLHREILGPVFDLAETARTQIERLGFSVRDVTDIVLTHLDLDHAGGISDFPDARVHVFRDEHAAATKPLWRERGRYLPAQWAHGPRWVIHPAQGAQWKGFGCVRDLPELPPEILLVPLVGHSRGHCAVAVDAGDHWRLHAGDAYFHATEMSAHARRGTLGFNLFQRAVAADGAAMAANRERLRQLALGDPAVRVFCAHDPAEFDRMRALHAPEGPELASPAPAA